MNDKKNIGGRPGSSAIRALNQIDRPTTRQEPLEARSKAYEADSQTGIAVLSPLLRRTIADPEWVGFVIAAPLIALLLTIWVLAVWPDVP